MKLNPDCVRALLLYLEEELDLNDSIDITEISLDGFNEREIIYSADKLLESNLISAYKKVAWGGDIMYFNVTAITADGCEFLDNIRGTATWEKIKEKTKKIGAYSLSSMLKIAPTVIIELAKGTFDI